MNILQKEHFFVPWIHPFPHLLRPFIVSFWPCPICSNLQDGTHCQVPGRNPVPLCFLLSMTANGSFRTLILCHMWNGRLYIGGLQEIISQGEIASIRQVNMVMSQTSKGKQKHNWRPWCKKGVYRFLADFHFFKDRANFSQTDLFWHETHRSAIMLMNLQKTQFSFGDLLFHLVLLFV